MISEQDRLDKAAAEERLVGAFIWPGPWGLAVLAFLALADKLFGAPSAALIVLIWALPFWLACHFIFNPDRVAFAYAAFHEKAVAAWGALSPVGARLVGRLWTWLSSLRPARTTEAKPSPLFTAKPFMGVAKREGALLGIPWKLVGFILVMLVILALGGALRSCIENGPFDFITESRDELRAERDAAIADKDLARHERGVASVAIDLAENTHHVERRAAAVVEQAKEEITDAVTAQDFDALAAAYGAAYDGVWNEPVDPGGPDPTPERPRGLLAAGASFVF